MLTWATVDVLEAKNAVEDDTRFIGIVVDIPVAHNREAEYVLYLAIHKKLPDYPL